MFNNRFLNTFFKQKYCNLTIYGACNNGLLILVFILGRMLLYDNFHKRPWSTRHLKKLDHGH